MISNLIKLAKLRLRLEAPSELSEVLRYVDYSLQEGNYHHFVELKDLLREYSRGEVGSGQLLGRLRLLIVEAKSE